LTLSFSSHLNCKREPSSPRRTRGQQAVPLRRVHSPPATELFRYRGLRHGRAALEGEDEGLEDVGALLVQGGEVEADGGEALGAGVGTEDAGDSLLELWHAQTRSAQRL
jgi:hypothetical protein